MDSVENIKKFAKEARRTLIDIGYKNNCKTHYGGILSSLDILSVLYKGIMNINVEDPEMVERDRFILSKGHGSFGQYVVLNKLGFISDELLNEFQKDDSDLGEHAKKNVKLGLEFNCGSLGHGISAAVGTLLASRMKKNNFKVYVLLGDGECNEGSIWEAAMSAVQFKLNNLIAIVDNNGFQSDGSSKEIMDMESLKDKWQAFGWNVIEVDGHNIEELYNKFKDIPNNEKPTVFIAKTVKGKYISFMENNAIWHDNIMTEEQYRQAINELEEL